ncbi:hypothetical protein JTE90_024026 [Oedothorax gibbosus]|uniref:Ig-like domain-containing protein n=1 Tax=Oedothorax gibbosus TaxID=931172 RepID=A0AAV6VCN1_9ARAC|nr:hypothetical protein JTE90_024026 [Oedothorax gibbosus]
MRYLDVYLLQLAVIHGVSCLRLKHLRIPPSNPSGRDAVLTCEYDLENEVLYSVKWFHNDQEFYRFAPREEPDTMFFPSNGIKIDLRYTNNTSVVLRDLELRTTGMYRCEVSADAPFFRTVTAEAFMIVGDFYGRGNSIWVIHVWIGLFFTIVWYNEYVSCGIQSFSLAPTDTEVIEGHDITLPCQVAHQKGAVQWSKGGILLDQHIYLLRLESLLSNRLKLLPF